MTVNGYRMDAHTFQHMGEWALRFGPFAQAEAEGVCNAMLAHLESLELDDAEYLMAQGWTRVYDAARDTVRALYAVTRNNGELLRIIPDTVRAGRP